MSKENENKKVEENLTQINIKKHECDILYNNTKKLLSEYYEFLDNHEFILEDDNQLDKRKYINDLDNEYYNLYTKVSKNRASDTSIEEFVNFDINFRLKMLENMDNIRNYNDIGKNITNIKILIDDKIDKIENIRISVYENLNNERGYIDKLISECEEKLKNLDIRYNDFEKRLPEIFKYIESIENPMERYKEYKKLYHDIYKLINEYDEVDDDIDDIRD